MGTKNALKRGTVMIGSGAGLVWHGRVRFDMVRYETLLFGRPGNGAILWLRSVVYTVVSYFANFSSVLVCDIGELQC